MFLVSPLYKVTFASITIQGVLHARPDAIDGQEGPVREVSGSLDNKEELRVSCFFRRSYGARVEDKTKIDISLSRLGLR